MLFRFFIKYSILRENQPQSGSETTEIRPKSGPERAALGGELEMRDREVIQSGVENFDPETGAG